jgi:hypothetical protein
MEEWTNRDDLTIRMIDSVAMRASMKPYFHQYSREHGQKTENNKAYIY